MGLTFHQSQKRKTFGVWLGRWRGCSVKKGKGNFLYSAVSIPQKNVSSYKVSPAICAVRLHLVHRESYLITKQGGNIENNGIFISLAQ